MSSEEPQGQFFSLGPDEVLQAIEQSGHRSTGLCYALNSLENRVYEVELEDSRRLVGKFYRPGRWSRETILDEHRLLSALVDNEVPVCAPLPFPDGSTLHETAAGIHFALFPRTGGRSPDELTAPDLEQLGRYIARIHNVSASLDLSHRPTLSPETYGKEALALLRDKGNIPPALEPRYAAGAERLITLAEQRWQTADTLVIHADCHRGNLLKRNTDWFFLDFDDSARAPPVQDLWLLLPGRRQDCKEDLEAMLRGYEQFRAFDHSTLRLIEALRGLRYIRYAAWIASRWQDPSFPRAFPYWGTERYWSEQVSDIWEQVTQLEEDQL